MTLSNMETATALFFKHHRCASMSDDELHEEFRHRQERIRIAERILANARAEFVPVEKEAQRRWDDKVGAT